MYISKFAVYTADVGAYVVKCICSSPTFHPHEFVQVRGELMPVTSLHVFQLPLHSIPITLNVIGMDPSNRINKM